MKEVSEQNRKKLVKIASKFIGGSLDEKTLGSIIKRVEKHFKVQSGHLTEMHGNLRLNVVVGSEIFKFDYRLKPTKGETV